MIRKKGKTVSFDAMVKFFMHNYDIPTKKDVEKILARIDRLENLIKTSMSDSDIRRLSKKSNTGKIKGEKGVKSTALDQVLSIIKKFNQGVGIAEIQTRTGYGEKKIRNIIYRLSKSGKIESKSRGNYIAV